MPHPNDIYAATLTGWNARTPRKRSDKPDDLNLHESNSALNETLELFGLSSKEDREEVLKQARLVTISSPWAPLVAKTAPDQVYLIHRGEVEVLKDGEVVATLGRGEMFGETALIKNALRNATVRVKGDVEVFHFTSDAFNNVFSNVSSFKELVTKTVDARN